VIENAGVALMEFTSSGDLETTLMVNIFGTFLLASLVLPKLQSSAAAIGQKTHLALVGSGAAFDAVGVVEKVDEEVNIFRYLSSTNKDMGSR
jgi:short-subunit dehydrogenase